MPRFEIRAQKFYTKELTKKAKAVEDMLPTPFSTDCEKSNKEITLSIQAINKEYKLITNKIVGRDYCATSTAISFISIGWNHIALRIYLYIINKLKYNSNYIIISYKDFNNYYNVSEKSFIEGINILTRPSVEHPCGGDSLSLLSKTTKKSLYIVNHNLLFKGNYDFFIENINIKYPNGCKLDSNGKVIIE